MQLRVDSGEAISVEGALGGAPRGTRCTFRDGPRRDRALGWPPGAARGRPERAVDASATARVGAQVAVEVLRQTGATLPGFILNGLPMGHGGYYYHYQAPGYGNDEVYGGSGIASRA